MFKKDKSETKTELLRSSLSPPHLKTLLGQEIEVHQNHMEKDNELKDILMDNSSTRPIKADKNVHNCQSYGISQMMENVVDSVKRWVTFG